jgi:motility quorum-sensing regulator/GCU-specific mRNA interferase toxin
VEKRKPSHDLAAVQAVLGDIAKLAVTTTALGDAVELGFDRAGTDGAIQLLTRVMFYKSMTT